MPYIKGTERPILKQLAKLLSGEIRTTGQLNFTLTMLCMYHLQRLGGENYDNYNTIIGVLECLKLEYYRKQVGVYEDVKEKKNGRLEI